MGKGGGEIVHLFCRECALKDLIAQRKEIKRAEREVEVREREGVEVAQREEEGRKRREVERFERSELGFEDEGQDDAGRKRKRLVAEEVHSSRVAMNGESPNDNTNKKSKSSESSFWTPGSEYANNAASRSSSTIASPKSTTHKFQPICPASTPTTQHPYSLKSLISVTFTIEKPDDSENAAASLDEPNRICPSCKKGLMNTSKPMLGTADGCGHVVCGSCAGLFVNGLSLKGAGAAAAASAGQNGVVEKGGTCGVSCVRRI